MYNEASNPKPSNQTCRKRLILSWKENEMKIFLDSANVKEIEKWLCYGIVDGVTTNPSIMLKDGIYNIEEGLSNWPN